MNSSRKVLLFLLLASLTGLLITGSQIYSRLTYFWLAAWVLPWLWSFFALRGLQFKRVPRLKRAHMGQIFEERYEVFNPSILPRLWIEVQDFSTLPGSRGSHVISLMGGRQRRTYLARTRLVRRGVFPLGPTVLASGDPFGLFPVQQGIPYQDSLLVYPMMYDIHEFPNPPGMLAGGEALRLRTHHVTPNAAGVREYLPGDSLSRIHWPTVARRDKLMVKEFELDPLADIWLFLDGERMVQASQPYTADTMTREIFARRDDAKITLPPATEEYLASIAASLSRFYLRRRRAVGLAVSGQSTNILPPDRGGRQLGKILEALAMLNCTGDLPIAGLIEAQAQHLTRGSTVVVITPSVRPKLPLAVDYLHRRGLRPVVVLINAETFGGNTGSDELAQTFKSMNLPVRLVSRGEDLATSLVMPA